MNEFKGTPGPWRQEHEVFKDGDCYRLRGSREEHLGDLYGAHREGEEAEYAANAKLIASAPRLYAALARLTQAAQDANIGYLDAAVAEGWDALEEATSISN